MDSEYKRLYEAWNDTVKFSAVMSHSNDEWNELLDWCKNNKDKFNSSILEQLKQHPTWAVQLLEEIYGYPVEIFNKDAFNPLSVVCTFWIYMLEGGDKFKGKPSFIDNYYTGDKIRIKRNLK